MVTYRLNSPETFFTYTGSDNPGKSDWEGWRLVECYVAPGAKGSKSRSGTYRLAIERDLVLGNDPADVQFAAIEVAERIEALWPYVTGAPIRRAPVGPHARLVEPPTDWTSNLEEVLASFRPVDQDLVTSLTDTRVEIRSSSAADWWPLERLVAALIAEPRLDETHRELFELHNIAIGSRSTRAYSVLMSVCLEIARELVPGATKAEKDSLLSEALGGTLSQSLDDLSAKANTYRETRHTITRRPVLALHPSMPVDEQRAYLNDVDSVIRFVICTALGIDAITWRDH